MELTSHTLLMIIMIGFVIVGILIDLINRVVVRAVICLGIISISIIVFVVMPMEQKEEHDFYMDHIHDIVINTTENTTNVNQKALQIREICSWFPEISHDMCIKYARQDALEE